MAVRLIEPRLGPGETHSPREGFDWSGISMLAQRAWQSQEIAHERRTLREIMAKARGETYTPQPTTWQQRAGGILGIGEKYQPISDLEKMQAEQMVKSQYPSGVDRYYGILSRAAEAGEDTPEGYHWAWDKQGRRIMEKDKEPPKPTAVETYRDDLNSARRGEMTWNTLKGKYPDKTDAIEKVRRAFLPKLEKSPKFRTGRGLSALISRDIAKLDAKTIKVIRQIENQEDLDELLERRGEAKIQGIDVDAILEYFGQR